MLDKIAHVLGHDFNPGQEIPAKAEAIAQECAEHLYDVAKKRGQFVADVRDATENQYGDALDGVRAWVQRAKDAEALVKTLTRADGSD